MSSLAPQYTPGVNLPLKCKCSTFTSQLLLKHVDPAEVKLDLVPTTFEVLNQIYKAVSRTCGWVDDSRGSDWIDPIRREDFCLYEVLYSLNNLAEETTITHRHPQFLECIASVIKKPCSEILVER